MEAVLLAVRRSRASARRLFSRSPPCSISRPSPTSPASESTTARGAAPTPSGASDTATVPPVTGAVPGVPVHDRRRYGPTRPAQHWYGGRAHTPRPRPRARRAVACAVHRDPLGTTPLDLTKGRVAVLVDSSGADGFTAHVEQVEATAARSNKVAGATGGTVTVAVVGVAALGSSAPVAVASLFGRRAASSFRLYPNRAAAAGGATTSGCSCRTRGTSP